MKIIYITNLDYKKKGGLFYATYERIIRHKIKNTCFVINNNYYDCKITKFIKKHIFKKNIIDKKKEKNIYENLEINNLNFKNNYISYLKRKFNLNTNFMNDVVGYYKKKYSTLFEDADIIHAHWGYPNGYIAYKLSKSYNKPYFITFHGSDINNIKDKDICRVLESMENAEKCFFVSEKLLKNAEKLGYTGKNAEVTYNGVDTNKFIIKNQHKNNYKTVGYIGSLKKVKGADLLPKIYKQISEISKEKIKFLVVGDGMLKEQLLDEFKNEKLDVKLTGHIDNNKVPGLLGKIDILIVPSRNEGLGMVILEANSMEIPAVGTKVGGIPEAIGFENNIIEFDDMIINMANRVVELLNKNNDNMKYRKRVLDEFNWDKTIEKESMSYIRSLNKD